MKIMYNHQIFHLKYGGISKYFYELAKNIASYKNSDIDVKINSPFYKNNYLTHKDKNLNFNGIKVPDFKGSGKLCLKLNSFISPFFLKNFNPDLIHETYYNSLSQKNVNTKKIITVHDMIHELFPNQFSSKDKTAELKNFAVNEADHILCNSYHTRNDLIKLLNVNIEKTSVIYHALSFVEGNEINKFEKENNPYILYVGSRNGYKNFIRFIKAYSNPKIKNSYNLIMFGGGKLNKKEIELLKKLKIKKESFKQISGNDLMLSNYYKSASLFVYPSLYEGFGVPPLEAMYNGCPVICSNSGSIPEVVGNAALFFDPYSEKSIQNQIISLLENSDLRSSLISKGFEQVKKYSWERCAKETYEVYDRILS